MELSDPEIEQKDARVLIDSSADLRVRGYPRQIAQTLCLRVLGGGRTGGSKFFTLAEPHGRKPNRAFDIHNLQFEPLIPNHGYIETLGFRIGDFAYSTDLMDPSDDAKATPTLKKHWSGSMS